jgi:hypothetical protein
MESWLKKGTVKHEMDKERDESTMPPEGSGHSSSLTTKKIKKEDNIPTG